MRLVSFGCSFTVGEGLEDIYPEDKTSKLAWPQKLADLVGCTVDNLGKSGASNKFILYRLLNHKFNQGDIVVVCWSVTDRWCIIKENGIYPFGIWNTEKGRLLSDWSEQTLQSRLSKIATAFYEHIHDDEDRKQEMHRDIELARLYLDSKGIKNYHMTHMSHGEYNWFNTKILDVNVQKIKEQNQLASDNHHPGTKAHQIVAEKVFELTKGLNI